MTVKQFYDYITQHMTPEQALMKLLEGSLIQYEKLKFDDQSKAVHPVLLISMAAMDMGWHLAVETNVDEVRGLTVGTEEYMKTIFKKDEKESDTTATDTLAS